MANFGVNFWIYYSKINLSIWLKDLRKQEYCITISAAVSYEKKKVGEKCSIKQRIKSESGCRNAAKALSLPWSSTFSNPGGNPGCTIANSFVYFNSRKDATGSDTGFVEICAITGEVFQTHKGAEQLFRNLLK